MRRNILILSCLLLSCHAGAAGFDPALLESPIELHDGDAINLAEIVGEEPIYLKFWASWCVPCRAEMPHLENTYKQHGNDLKIISVNIWVNETASAIDSTVDEFGLTMPIAIDKAGTLAQSFDFIGTPYHVLIDGDGNVVHTGFEANAELDQKIDLLASNRHAGLVPVAASPAENTMPADIAPVDGDALLYFTATWCDWYLEESRPAMSAACIDAQRGMNQLYSTRPDLPIQGVAMRLWTDDKQLEEYIDKYTVAFPMTVDTNNETFFSMNVNTVPTLIVIKDGREVARTSDLRTVEKIANFIHAANR